MRVITVLSCFLVLCMSCGGPKKAVQPPVNLLLISIDTLRADRLGCYGYQRDTSARIDEVASEGVLFENCFVPSCKTTPSHMSMMTALYPQVHDIYMWERNAQGPYSGKVLPENIPTLADRLKESGYQNVAFTGGGNVAGRIGFGRSFEIYTEDDNNAAAVKWLTKKRTDRPFFMFYHTYYTHDPYLPPPPYDTKYDPDYTGSIPSKASFLAETGMSTNDDWHGQWDALHELYWSKVNINDPHDVLHLSALYDGCINNVDHHFIGSLLDALREQGVLDNTLIVITSDHGEEFLEHGRILHDSLYREVTHIPLIMRLPGKLPEGRRVKQLVRNIDIMPTILELLEIPLKAKVQGVSLMPAVIDDKSLDLAVYADFDDYAPPYIQSVRKGSWFLLMDQRSSGNVIPALGSSSVFMQLYNTKQDLREQNNVIGDVYNDAARMAGLLRQLRIDCAQLRETGVQEENQATIEMDEENIRRLKSLGYLR